jgi:two-component SAPR family response regulator
MKNQSWIYIGLVLIVLVVPQAMGQNLYHTGLLFNAAPLPKEQRTSLNLTDESPIVVRNSFSLDFDFALWNNNQFGYVFRIYNKQNNNIDLVFVPGPNGDGNLKLAINGRPTTINLPLTERELIRNHWINLRFRFDLKKGNVTCTKGNATFIDNQVNLTGFSKIYICFGVNRGSYFPTTDVPNMAVRNIRINDFENKIRHNWLLNESEGNEATDLVGNLIAKADNPNWIINNHFFWNKQTEFKLNSSSGVTIDTAQNRIIFVATDQIISYDIIHAKTSVRYTQNEKQSVEKSESYFYSPFKKTIYCIGKIPSPVETYNEFLNQWESPEKNDLPRLYSNPTYFMDERSQSAFSLGGYSNYKYNNKLLQYNLQDRKWEEYRLKGDNLLPRYFASVTPTAKAGEYFVFGGYGNASGQQELGPQCLYDLYLLNLNDSSITKKWSMENIQDNFIPMGSTTTDEQNPALYVLGFPPFLNDTYLRLYRVSLDNPGYSVVSDTLHFFFDEEQSKATLFFFKKTQEFYAVLKSPEKDDSATYRIFSLTYPPVNRQLMTFTFQTILSNPESFPHYIYWLVLAFSLVMLFLFLFLLKKLHLAEEKMEESEELQMLIQDKTPVIYENPQKTTVVLPEKNAIYLFGEFRILDDQGNDLASDFTIKLKQLFLSILLLANDDNGVSNEKLNSIHWTYHTPQSAKNNRNVNIKKIRDILASTKGIQILHQDGFWSVRLSGEIFCDYQFILKKLKNSTQPITREEFEKIILILNQGMLVDNEKAPWLDSVKSKFTTALLDYLFTLASSFEKSKNPQAIQKIANAILKSDPLNEEAFKLKIESLVMQKNRHQAFVEYEYFTREYEKMYGVSFPQSFKSFFNSES